MQLEFWQDKWQQGQQGFDQSTPNPLLTEYFSTLNIPTGARVLVPLCGKSVDMLWLAGQGYNVVGIELIEDAVVEFFAHNNIQATLSSHPTNDSVNQYIGRFNGQCIEIWVANIFDLTQNDVGDIAAVYDRAAIIALTDTPPDNTRYKYSQHLIALSDRAPQLVVLLGYDGDNEHEVLARQNPPFIVTPQQLQDYYSDDYDIQAMHKTSTDAFTSYGDSGFHTVYKLLPKLESSNTEHAKTA